MSRPARPSGSGGGGGLEGLEGVGKTTNLAFIESQVRQRGLAITVTREPGGTPLGEKLRHLVLHEGLAMAARTELLLVLAARTEHLDTVILPALARGDWVLSDRYVDASYAYQGGGRELGSAFVEALHHEAGVTRLPDLTLLLDLPVEIGAERIGQRGEIDRIEQEDRAFFERARAVYRERAAADPTRIKLIDAAAPLQDVQAAIVRALTPLLESPVQSAPHG